jgi:hypothetical protein
MAYTFLEDLRRTLDAFSIPLHGQSYSVSDYFQLTPEVRGDDEADVVDMRLARLLLNILGYENDRDWEYNRNKSGGRPDFLVVPEGRPSFFIEDKRTSLPLVLSQLEPQLRRYAESLTSLGLAFNGREVLAIRLVAGRISPILRVDLLAAAGIVVLPEQLSLDPEGNKAALGVLVELFQRDRFTSVQGRIKRLACSETEWKAQSREINSSIDAFGEHAARLIVRLSKVAYVALTEHLQESHASSHEMARLEDAALKLVLSTPVPPAEQDKFVSGGKALASGIGRIQESRIPALSELLRNRMRARRFTEQLRALNAEARNVELHYEESLEVSRRYERWRDLEQRFEASIGDEGEETEEKTELTRRWRFARQCAYVLFLRILLVRILEDKRLLRQRLITDGGLELWLDTVRNRFAPHLGDLSSAPLIDLALGQAEAVAGSMHRRDIYDWYMPDDASILDILEVLHSYDFSRLATDVIGYTYQRFLEETERHRLGHYLTPPAVIDHMLDVAGYVPSNPEIIGRDVLDPACGSGSFLVHAAVRYRQALAHAYREDVDEASRAFIQAIQERFIGIDINTFSCYLARINLLVQALDDIASLAAKGETASLGELAIHNADSLDFKGIEGAQQKMNINVTDDVLRLKAFRAEQIQYVFANPPYINVKQENLYLSDVQALPFFSTWLHGDANTYLLFLRVALHFLSPNGVLAFIVPSTVLGDQQAERFRRRALQEGFRFRAITRFYAEKVLFNPVEQATSVLVMSRTTEDSAVIVRGGGMGANSVEALQDVERRPAIELSAERLRVWIGPARVPIIGPAVVPSADQWMLLWPVMPERAEYYALWEILAKNSQLTVGQLFERIGFPLSNGTIRQGDVNTTYVSPFHVPANTDGCIPMYKGEEIDHLIPLDYLPTRGPSGRTPFLAVNEEAAQTSSQRTALAELNRIAHLKAPERGFVLHEVAKFRVPRRIAGTYFERGGTRHRVVFPHTLWVAAGLPQETSQAMLGLLTSLPMNFVYHFWSTNNHVSMSLVTCLPVPEKVIAGLPKLSELTATALKSGHSLLTMFNELGVDRGRALRSGAPVIDPATLLHKKKLAVVSATAWAERGWLKFGSNAGARERFSVAILVERGQLLANGPPGVADVLNLWVQAYGTLKWREFENMEIPDDPGAFLKAWSKAQGDLESSLARRESDIQAIDEGVADIYRIPKALREVMKQGPPWLAGKDRNQVQESDEDE